MNAFFLQDLLLSPQPPFLLHVMPEEHFKARRIEGAKNACVYEVSFVDNVRTLIPDLTAPIVVYGEGAPSLDSEDALLRLREAGFVAVSDFRGGMREWQAVALPITNDAPLPATPIVSGNYLVDTETSLIRWTGRNLFNHHQGHLKLKEGRIEVKDGALLHADFTVDMNSIVCEDLADSGYNAMLIRHLRSSDFFDIEKHPTALFVATRAEKISGTEGTPNFQITGLFTLRSVVQEITFPAVIAAADADHITAQAQIEIDRTRWGSRYGSGKFFAFLGGHVVNDHIQLHLKIQTEKHLS